MLNIKLNGILLFVTFILVLLKLSNVITFSWWVVLAPILAIPVFIISVITFSVLFIFFALVFENKFKRI